MRTSEGLIVSSVRTGGFTYWQTDSCCYPSLEQSGLLYSGNRATSRASDTHTSNTQASDWLCNWANQSGLRWLKRPLNAAIFSDENKESNSYFYVLRVYTAAVQTKCLILHENSWPRFNICRALLWLRHIQYGTRLGVRYVMTSGCVLTSSAALSTWKAEKWTRFSR